MAYTYGLTALLEFFKTMADENRLRIIGLTASQPMRTSDLAQALDLSEPTISHHVSKLREINLLNLKQEGTNRYYKLNQPMLKRMLDLTANLEEIVQRVPAEKPDMSWIDDLDMDDKERKVFKDYFVGQRLKQIPSKPGKLFSILRWLAAHFEPGRKYTEPEVNAIIEQIHPDYATLRRELVEAHLLRREGGGGVYWRA